MMEPHLEETGSDSLMEKIHHDSSSSSSDSDNDKHAPSSKGGGSASASASGSGSAPPPLGGKPRLFGRQKPVHTVLGGGRSADIILWRDKQIAAGILIAVTLVWFLFECLGYHLLTFICHSLIVAIGVLFLWSNLSGFVNKSPPKFPEIILPEDLFVSFALQLRYEINRAFTTFRLVASGKDLMKFIKVIAILWVISVVGSWFNFLTLFYIVYVMLHTVPVLYEKHEDHVDTLAEKAMVEINKQYAVLDEKVLRKLPKYAFAKDKKHQ